MHDILPGHPNPKSGKVFVDWVVEVKQAIGGHRATAVAAQAAYEQAERELRQAKADRNPQAAEQADGAMGRAERTVAYCNGKVDELLEQLAEALAARDRG